jgi:hypothetical protein
MALKLCRGVMTALLILSGLIVPIVAQQPAQQPEQSKELTAALAGCDKQAQERRDYIEERKPMGFDALNPTNWALHKQLLQQAEYDRLNCYQVVKESAAAQAKNREQGRKRQQAIAKATARYGRLPVPVIEANNGALYTVGIDNRFRNGNMLANMCLLTNDGKTCVGSEWQPLVFDCHGSYSRYILPPSGFPLDAVSLQLLPIPPRSVLAEAEKIVCRSVYREAFDMVEKESR